MWKKLGLVGFGFVVSLLILEIALRIYLMNFGTDAQKILYLYDRNQIEEVGRRFEGAAYLNFMLSPVRPEHNSLGYRGEEITIPKPAHTFRIVALGGSTTYGEFIEENTQTYPAQLEQILHDEYGLTQVEVVNAGVPAYTTWESLVSLQFRILDLDPDLIIIYHGVNDINPRLTDPTIYSGRNAPRGYWTGDDNPIPYSALYRFVLVRLGWNPPISFKIETQFVRPPGYEDCGLQILSGIATCTNYAMAAQDVMEANPPVYFEKNTRNMILIARGNNIAAVLANWAYSRVEYDVPGGDFMTEPFRQNAVREHNLITEALAGELNVPFYDFVKDMSEDPQYWVDGLHVNASGAQLQAKLFASFLVEKDLVPEV